MYANRKVLLAVAMIVMSPTAFADVITDWNENAVRFVTPRMAPPAAQRAVTMVQVAMFDAVNSIERRYHPYLVQLPAPPTASKEAAAAAAAGVVLASLLPQTDGEVKGAMASYLAAIPNGAAKSEGIKLGEAVAANSWRCASETVLTHPTPIGRRQRPASIFQRQSPSARPGQM